MKGKYPVIIIVMMGIITAVLACNLSSDSAIEAAIAKTETARPRPTNTPILIPTQIPTDPPEPTPPPLAQISMLEAILTSNELDAGLSLIHPATIDRLPVEMLVSCAIDCAGKDYENYEGDIELIIEIDRVESAEAAINIAKNFPFEGTILTQSDGTKLTPIEMPGFDTDLWPDNAWMVEIDPDVYHASASNGSVVIRLFIIIWADVGSADYSVEVAETNANFYLSYAMARQVAKLVEIHAD